MATPSPSPTPTHRIDPAAVGQQAGALVSSSIAWLQTHWLQIAIAVGVGTAIALALMWLRSLGPRLAARSTSGLGWSAVIGRAIQRTGNFFIVMVAARLVSGYAQPPANVASTIGFLFTVAAVFQCAVWARELILGAIEHRTRAGIDGREGGHEALSSAMGLIRLLVSIAVFAIALVVVLSNLGVNVTGLIAGLGVGGIAIGLAAQGIFADLFAALAIIFDRPFRRGDAITYAGSSGSVEAIGLKSTRVRGADGELRVIANKKLLDNEILNNTTRQYRRIKFTLGLVQWTDVAVMEALPGMLKEVVEKHDAKFVRAGFIAFAASSYDFDVEFDSPSPAFQDAFDRRHVIGLAIIRRLNDEGIELAYPTQTDFTAAPNGGLIYPYPKRQGGDRPTGGVSEPIRATSTRGTDGSDSAVDQD